MESGAAGGRSESGQREGFREGNGRAQREFIRQLAGNAGYLLDWSRVDKTCVMRASIRSKVDTQDLSEVLWQCLDKMS